MFRRPLIQQQLTRRFIMAAKRLALIVIASMLALSACSASVTTGYPAHYGYYDSYGYWHRY